MDPLFDEEIIIEKLKVESLKEFQKKAITAILEEKDCFVSQPTGTGKSLVYQALPLLKPGGYVLVISPLIALMQDQMNKLERLGIKTIRLSYKDKEQNKKTSMQLQDSQIIFASPEALLNVYLETLRDEQFGEKLICIAVDESHMIVNW